jgi:hypothetical protein
MEARMNFARKRSLETAGLAAAALLLSAASVLAQTVNLPVNRPTDVGGTQVACTGVGTNERDDPQWSSYPFKLELAVPNGALLGESDVTVSGGSHPPIAVHCAGPWVLFQLPAGHYSVSATTSGATKTASVDVPSSGQKAITLMFPSVPAQVKPAE